MKIFDQTLDEFLQTLKVLYVEDNDAARLAISELLSLFFNDITIATDGMEGFETFLDGDFDIVISDIKMPRMDGVEMTKKIRKISPNVPIIMTTAHQESEYLLECIKNSVDAYLLKPIDVRSLEDVVYKVADKIFCDLSRDTYEQKLEELVLERTKELERVHLDLVSMINKDPLTGLYNRRYFNEISETLVHMARRGISSLSALMVDIDHFKLINDTHGHLVGDEVIKKIARILLDVTRESDIVVRFGGEEFVLLLPNTSIDGANRIAQKIRHYIESQSITPHKEKEEIHFTVSIGVSSCECEHDVSIDNLIHRIDVAMYDAKRSGRNKVAVYNQDSSY